MGLYTGGLIFGMVRVLVNGWAYTWGSLYSGGGLNSEVYGNIKAAAILRFKMGINIYRWRPKYMLGVMSLSARGVKRLFLKYVNTPS